MWKELSGCLARTRQSLFSCQYDKVGGKKLLTKMKTQAVNKLQLPQSSFINTDGDFDNGIVHMNMGMVFQYDYLEGK
jgi:hypothetical protein